MTSTTHPTTTDSSVNNPNGHASEARTSSDHHGNNTACHPPYPTTERQAEFIAMANDLAEIAAANAPRHDRDNSFPFDTFKALRESGYLALTVPEEFGGRGATALETMLAQERLARGDGGVAFGSTMSLINIAGQADNRTWPDELWIPFCRDVVAHGALINNVASEPDLGSPSRGGMFATTAQWTPDGWVINGHKSWATLAPALDYAVVMLTTIDGHGKKARGNLLVAMRLPGISIEETWDNLGMRSSGSHDVMFENVLVPLENLLPTPQVAPGNSVSPWSLVTSAVYLGIATAARDFAVNFAQHRVPSGLGKPIAELQTVQHRIAQIELLLLQSRSVLYGTVETWERFPEQREVIAWQFAAAKYTVTNNAIAITDQALRVVGSVGLQKQNPLERYFRDVRAGLGNPPMDDIALTLIGKNALGLS